MPRAETHYIKIIGLRAAYLCYHGRMIRSENLHFSYLHTDEGLPPQPALAGINLSVGKGDFVVIAGRNGSGKSTLARHINALLSPSEGTLWVNGIDTKDETQLWEIRKTAGMVFQNPDNQIVAATIEEDVAFGPENLGVPSEEIRTRVDSALAAVKMSEYANAAPHHLSGGQKQRAAIASVLAMRPSVIVFDESTSMLDPQGRREVLETIDGLRRTGITIILITHSMEEAALADRLIVMDRGKIVLEDTPRAVFRQANALTKLGLAVPQAAALAQALRERGVPVSDGILSAEDLLADEAVQKAALKYASANHPVPKVTAPLPSQPHPLLEIRNLTHIYNAGAAYEKKAVDGISLTIGKGETVGIIGHTGSGKSTLIQHFNALLTPTSGQVLIDGEDIHADKKKLKTLRQRVGMLFQYPEHQLFESDVYRDVAFGPTRMGLSDEEIKTRVVKALTIVGLGEDVYNKSPFALSGGQKRRAAIAGVLAMQPEILVLDEPAAGLDPQGREGTFSQITKMREELGLTVIIISHNMDDIARLCGRVIAVSQGKIIADGTPAEVFSQNRILEESGLDIPQVTRVMARLAESNPAIPTGIFTVEDAANVLSGGGEGPL
ncbi:MAG: energy-coupling factor transporter ATPase [Defluviitaleaceae bacterium]|nr:energy-coupling factor transporter ATPase [Defluviitaleaceae bacterium]